ncbi:hypothetical protein FKG94_23250 [Exilibacterium tricleocarpae]|uniref:Guanylate cyclase domain-containing protein n=1 Tax=Exilibacterium tricleocarpae TaxID=2591008 RepID=A0A545SXM2_9GAMM|nr:hypothetical protein [Exilibacterium tricleocarpae]TQV69710.1 hypothetical protein FKG94_23250 [Exilibacterium tricleocarpae]
MTQGYFLVADILGFGEIISNLEIEEQVEKINDWQELIRALTQKYQLVRFQLISDTLFIGIFDDVNELENLIDFCKELLSRAIVKSIPIRGAISKGEYIWGEHLVYGKAVIAAHKHEMNQNWIGISFFPEFEGIESLWGKLVCYQIPTKSGQNQMGAVIRWDIPSLDDLGRYLVEGGLTGEHSKIDQKWISRLEQTIMFSLYLKIIDNSAHEVSEFHGLGTPVHIIEQALLTSGCI